MIKKDLEAYRNIKAPAELRERVMRLEQEAKFQKRDTARNFIHTKSLATIVCAAVICLVFFTSFGTKGEVLLLFQGTPIEANPTVIAANNPQMATRHMAGMSGISLELQTKQKTKISVSGGTISLFNLTGELLQDGIEVEFSGDALLWWDVSGTDEATLSLTLKTDTEDLTYILTTSGNGEYILQKSEPQ
ncbi:MAG: hypothetical protein KHZ62_06750 [Clostridiales bacterium]|nr:hypothetical protein [Clostridiales bacterium]